MGLSHLKIRVVDRYKIITTRNITLTSLIVQLTCVYEYACLPNNIHTVSKLNLQTKQSNGPMTQLELLLTCMQDFDSYKKAVVVSYSY